MFFPQNLSHDVSGKAQATGEHKKSWLILVTAQRPGVGGAVAWWQKKGESQEGKAKFGFGFSLKSFISALLPDFDVEVRLSRVAAFAVSKARGISQRKADTEALCLPRVLGQKRGFALSLPSLGS